jgi:hypothetical protein
VNRTSAITIQMAAFANMLLFKFDSQMADDAALQRKL